MGPVLWSPHYGAGTVCFAKRRRAWGPDTLIALGKVAGVVDRVIEGSNQSSHSTGASILPVAGGTDRESWLNGCWSNRGKTFYSWRSRGSQKPSLLCFSANSVPGVSDFI